MLKLTRFTEAELEELMKQIDIHDEEVSEDDDEEESANAQEYMRQVESLQSKVKRLETELRSQTEMRDVVKEQTDAREQILMYHAKQARRGSYIQMLEVRDLVNTF
jgi:TolA-binding protein